MVEYANMRLKLVCAMAAKLPHQQRQHRHHDEHLLPVDGQAEQAAHHQADDHAERGNLGRAGNQQGRRAVGAP